VDRNNQLLHRNQKAAYNNDTNWLGTVCESEQCDALWKQSEDEEIRVKDVVESAEGEHIEHIEHINTRHCSHFIH
jgi:hypothetical protein